MSGLGLAELFDLESLLLKEKAESEEVRRTRYRNLGRRLVDQGAKADDPAALLQAFLRLDPATPSPGERVEAALGWFHSLVGLAGALLGGALALGLLHSGSPHPVNVLNVLAGLVGVQIVLLLLLLIAVIPRGRRRAPGLVQELLLRVFQRLLGKLMPQSDPELLRNVLARLDAHSGLTRWLLVRAAQIFGVAFNLAALSGCLCRILFTDVAFGWSTTLHVDAAELRRLLQSLAAPWSWFLPQGVPSLQMVEMTQYSHLEGKYLLRAAGERSVNPMILGGWWRFLFLAVTTYGFLPRLVVLTIAEVRVRRILRDTPARNEEYRKLVDWMRLPVVTTSSDETPMSPPVLSGAAPGELPALPPPGASCELRTDGSLGIPRERLDRMVKDRFGWTVSEQSADGPLLVLVSAWEEPTKGNQRRFQGLPAGRLVIVALVNPSPDGAADPRLERIRERWRRELRLRVEALP